MLSVQTNIQSMFTNRSLKKTKKTIASATEKLSSGYRINRAADDAAGLAISEKMRRQIRGLSQASDNAQDGISLLQIADGAMSEIQDMLHRCTELTVKAANGTNSMDDRAAIQAEIDQIKAEINVIAAKTEFNERPLLNGEDIVIKNGVAISSSLPSWVTYTGGGYMNGTYTTNETYTESDGITQGSMAIDHAAAYIDFSGYTGNVNDLIDKGFHFTCCTCNRHYSIQFTSGTTGSVESSGNHYVYSVGIDGINNANDLLNRIISQVGTNPSNHYTNLTIVDDKLVIYDDRGNNNSAQLALPSNATWDNTWTNKGQYAAPNVSMGWGIFGPGIATSLTPKDQGTKLFLQIGTSGDSWNRMEIILPDMKTRNLDLDGVNVTTEQNARAALMKYKEASSFVSKERSRLGAYQNRLEHTIRNLDNVGENTQAAESRIRDADMSKEMVEYSKDNILMQVEQAMLSQNNNNREAILSLLQ